MTDHLRRARQFIEIIPHAKALGMVCDELGDGCATIYMDYDPRFVGDLRNGRSPRPDTERRVEHFMNTYRRTSRAA